MFGNTDLDLYLDADFLMKIEVESRFCSKTISYIVNCISRSTVDHQPTYVVCHKFRENFNQKVSV